jgi:O-antigen/teichoic acid export membrane protein
MREPPIEPATVKIGTASSLVARDTFMNLARRSITSVAWNSAVSLSNVVILFARYVILRRLLSVDTFGVYSGANAVVGLTIIVAGFGMGGAFLHRAQETEDEELAAAVHFTLKLIFTLSWASVMATITALFFEEETRTALFVLIIANSGIQLAQTPTLILTRRVVHKRLALIQFLNALLTTFVAITLALQGYALWALLATDIATMVLTLGALYIWRPVWRPRLVRSPEVMRYFLHFGARNFLSKVLLQALDLLDDVWTRFFLGTTPMGYYSTAYRFATYPRTILAAPINAVAGGTYAELKLDRKRLSQAFFRTNALLIRTGFLFGGLLVTIAPEFILLILGEKWLPMLNAFRLMLVFTLLDPIKLTVADLFVAVGHPEQITRARLVQLVVMAIGLFTLGPPLGITGVALAVDLMLVVGMVILLWQARAHIDFSPRRMFAVPTLALALALVASHAVLAIPGLHDSAWWLGGIKAAIFIAIYSAVVLLLEFNQVPMLLRTLRQALPKRHVLEQNESLTTREGS